MPSVVTCHMPAPRGMSTATAPHRGCSPAAPLPYTWPPPRRAATRVGPSAAPCYLRFPRYSIECWRYICRRVGRRQADRDPRRACAAPVLRACTQPVSVVSRAWSTRKAQSPRHRGYRSPSLYLLLSPRAVRLGAAPAALRSAACLAAKAKTKNDPAGGSEPPCRATAASSPEQTLLSDGNSNTPLGLSSNQKTDGAADARTVDSS